MKFVLKKIAGLIIALLIVSVLAFLAFEVIPGDPARSILGTEATESKVEALREEMGLNRPLPQRYGQWVKDFVTGDMGTSYSYQVPVREMIGDKVPVTAAMTLMAFVFILLFSIPVSLLSVRYADKFVDRLFLVLNQVTMSVPPFFVGIILTVVFGLTFRLVYAGGICFLYGECGRLSGVSDSAVHCNSASKGGNDNQDAEEFSVAGNAPGLYTYGYEPGQQSVENAGQCMRSVTGYFPLLRFWGWRLQI